MVKVTIFLEFDREDVEPQDIYDYLQELIENESLKYITEEK